MLSRSTPYRIVRDVSLSPETPVLAKPPSENGSLRKWERLLRTSKLMLFTMARIGNHVTYL